MVFTTKYGLPVEPRNFNRSCDSRIRRANLFTLTMEIYSQISSQAAREALRRLGESLDR